MGKTGPKTEAGLATVSANSRELDHSAWTKNPEAVEAIETAKRLRNTKHGMYAAVPIICKADGCPYAQSCPLLEMAQAPYGEKCPIEIAAIEDLFGRYAEHFDINLDNKKAGDTVDLMMVKDLVDADIGILRCDSKMAWDADYIIHNTVGVTDNGDPITKQELHPLTDYREKLVNRKHKTFQLLNSTRKDKVGSKITVSADPSVRAAEMLKVHEDMARIEQEEKEAELAYYKKMNSSIPDVIDVEPIDFEKE
ncbi:hypothetical protein [Oceanobacillus profundus]|uniref:Uncharacterized protein n=1 Tax=Oceanobacillus profundus TaxID=372463 RepID=A0A417YGN5_9BACI|nr:hypothetical protein [Oceanobacillus profundus]MBR2246157.1 hypothetical protein [Bacilli bacterium]MBR3119827.1 hypothetical protein [Oceanobacillus sp.]RHW31971.1 hypothetical protein D1B32_12095 [Oceanobacillus profundus]